MSFVDSALLVVAVLAAGVMGFAIQRGATCTVAAVDEFVNQRGTRRLAAMVEASLWVAGGLLLARQLHWLAQPLGGYPASGWTVLGAALLGVGAYVNRACVFGAIARLGSGDWAYAATPLGFYAGCLSVAAVFAPPPPVPLDEGSVVLASADVALWPLLLFVAWRLARLASAALTGGGSATAAARRAWTPHTATLVIGITFVVTLLLAGGVWAYTDALADLARGMASHMLVRLLLVFALFAGALLGGWSAGLLRSAAISAGALLRCFIGGVMMAWGSALVPGSNDGLLLVGMPLLWPYAWLAFATMCLTIASAILVQKRWLAPAR